MNPTEKQELPQDDLADFFDLDDDTPLAPPPACPIEGPCEACQ